MKKNIDAVNAETKTFHVGFLKIRDFEQRTVQILFAQFAVGNIDILIISINSVIHT